MIVKMDDAAIRDRLDEYAAGFSRGEPERVVAFYKPGAVITFHLVGADELRAYNGGWLGALVRGALPATRVVRMLFRNVEKSIYDHSSITVHDVRGDRALLTFDRVNRLGTTFESAGAIYRVEAIGAQLFIAEAWLFDSLDDARKQFA